MKELIEDRRYCASSYLMYRTIIDDNKTFSNKYSRNTHEIPENRIKIHSSDELHIALQTQVEKLVATGKKVALCLSGGIDSGILARFLPKDTIAYTFKCVVPGQEVTDETPGAAKYAKECGLDHRIVEIYWEDFENYTPTLLKHKGMPFHSIEVQMYKAGLQAKKDGVDVLIYGESADLNYGGLSILLSQDWTVGQFIDRYAYVKPYAALKESDLVLDPIHQCEQNGYIDVHKFNTHPFMKEALNSYYNACETANIEYFLPYSNTVLDVPLDLKRIRNGENKYLIREIFTKLYPGFEIPPKTPMPRPMDEWFSDWQGPTRPEFWPHCTDPMSGDQRWLVWCLERYLNLLDEA